MTTENTAAISIPETKLQMTSTISLNGADGSTLQVVAERKGEGAKTYVITTDANKKSARGMTELHATFEEAKAATEKIAAKAVKAGWVRREARKGFAPKPDAFTTLPAAPKAKK